MPSGELTACALTKANVDDRKPIVKLVEKLIGWLFADKDYLGQPLIDKLKQQVMDIFTKVRSNMKARLMNDA